MFVVGRECCGLLRLSVAVVFAFVVFGFVFAVACVRCVCFLFGVICVLMLFVGVLLVALRFAVVCC